MRSTSIASNCSPRPMPNRPTCTPKATAVSSSRAPSAASRKCAAPTILPRGTAPHSIRESFPGELLMRRIALLLACLSASATAAPNPVTQPSKLDPAWQAKTRAFFEQAIEIPTVVGRGQVPKMAQLVADQLKAGGFAGNDIRIIPYEGLPGDKTAALVFRWRADGPTRKP